jgi:hypothetical protein
MSAPNSSTSTASAFSGASLSSAAASSLRQRQRSSSVLFEMKEDARPASECTAAGRYTEPTLFAFREQGH